MLESILLKRFIFLFFFLGSTMFPLLGQDEMLNEDGVYPLLAGLFPKKAFLSRSRYGGKQMDQEGHKKSEVHRNLLSNLVHVSALVHQPPMATSPRRDPRIFIFWNMGEIVAECFREGVPSKEIKRVAKKMGTSYEQLKLLRLFYSKFSWLSPQLAWEHYYLLVSIEEEDERQFLLRMAVGQAWSAFELSQAIEEDLFSKSSKDFKDELMEEEFVFLKPDRELKEMYPGEKFILAFYDRGEFLQSHKTVGDSVRV